MKSKYGEESGDLYGPHSFCPYIFIPIIRENFNPYSEKYINLFTKKVGNIMRKLAKTLVMVVFVALIGTVGIGGYLYMDAQKTIEKQKSQILDLTQQNVRTSVELQNTCTELETLKGREMYHGDGNFHAVVFDKDGKEYQVMSAKTIFGNTKTVVWQSK